MIKRGAIFIGSEKKSFLSETIREVSHSKWSHCGIITDSTNFETYVLGARGRGVDITTISSYDEIDDYYYEIYEINHNPDLIEYATRFVLDKYLEKPYGYFELLGFYIWFKLKDIFGITLKRNPITFWTVCSELESIYLKLIFMGEIKEVTDWDNDLVTPEDVSRLIEKYPNYFTKVKEKII